MEIKPLVSVIITTYKRHDYLERAVKSVLAQTYSNIEVIIVDDNEPTTEYSNQVQLLLKEINDNRIRYISMGRNAGACTARNYGFANSHGLYIDFLDDDDEFMPEKIAVQIEKFASVDKKVGTIGCFAQIRNEYGEIIQRDHNKVRGDVFYQNLCQSLCQTSLPLFKREVFEKSGGFEPIISSQEHLMLSRIFNICPYYDYVDRELVAIYHHSGERISNRINKPQGAIELAERFKRYYYKLNNEQIKKLELAMNKNIINSFVLVNDRKNAGKYYQQRKKLRDGFTFEDAKLLFGIVFGSKAKAILHRAILRQ